MFDTKTTAGKFSLMTGNRLLDDHSDGTVRSVGLDFTVVPVPNTTAVRMTQLHTRLLCSTEIDRASSYFSVSAFLLLIFSF